MDMSPIWNKCLNIIHRNENALRMNKTNNSNMQVLDKKENSRHRRVRKNGPMLPYLPCQGKPSLYKTNKYAQY